MCSQMLTSLKRAPSAMLPNMQKKHIAAPRPHTAVQDQQQRGHAAKTPRSDLDGPDLWSTSSVPARGGPGRAGHGAMRGAKRQHAAPY